MGPGDTPCTRIFNLLYKDLDIIFVIFNRFLDCSLCLWMISLLSLTELVCARLVCELVLWRTVQLPGSVGCDP